MNKSLYDCAKIGYSKTGRERKSSWSKSKWGEDKKAREIWWESEVCKRGEYWNHPANLRIVGIRG
jgi:hypothetical protein